jgi:hypothetical protein
VVRGWHLLAFEGAAQKLSIATSGQGMGVRGQPRMRVVVALSLPREARGRGAAGHGARWPIAG